MSPPVRHISYRTPGQQWAGYATLGLGAAALCVALAAGSLFGDAGPGGVLAVRIVSGFAATVFLFLGLVLALQDREVAIDASRGVLGVGWSWFRWRRMTLYAVETDDRIHLDAVEVSAGRTTTTHYRVSYVHERDATEIVSGADYRLSRQRAEVLARSLGLPLVDRTSGSEVVRGPDALDRSAADAATLPDGLVWPRLPPGTRVHAHYERDSLSLTIPPPGFGGVTLFALLLLGFGAVPVWLLLGLMGSQIHWTAGVLLGLLFTGLGLLFGYGGYQGLADTLWRTRRLAVSPSGIRSPLREGDEGRELVEASAIEEIDVVEGGAGVIARTDEADVELASYLEPDEAQCLRDMVHLALAGRGPQGHQLADGASTSSSPAPGCDRRSRT